MLQGWGPTKEAGHQNLNQVMSSYPAETQERLLSTQGTGTHAIQNTHSIQLKFKSLYQKKQAGVPGPPSEFGVLKSSA